MFMRTLKLFGLMLALAALSGCATSWVVDSTVSSHGMLKDFTPSAGYRFERLPSQQAADTARRAQSELEAMAAPALAAVGLRLDEVAPRYSVQVSARVERVPSPWGSPWDSPWVNGAWGPAWHPHWGWGPTWAGDWYDGGLYGPPPQPWYLREVSLVMRQLPGNEIVYETRARHDGPYNRSRDVLPVMFRAALQGFPTTPSGERQVDIRIGADPTQTPTPSTPPQPARP